MAVVEVSYEDLKNLIGVDMDRKELMDTITMFGTPVDEEDGDIVRIEVFPNRPDMLSVEGIARSMRLFLGKEKGVTTYSLSAPNTEAKVGDVKIRPECCFCVVKNVKFNDAAVASIMQIQEKLHTTHGRRRRKVAIGIHDLDKVKGPITYRDERKSEVEFVPLGETKSMTAEEILTETPKGRDYAHLVPGERVPIIRDSTGQVLSFPPIINSEYSKVVPSTKNILIDVTGTDARAVEKAAIIVATSLAERGAEIELVKIGDRLSPDFTPQTMKLDVNYANRLLGLDLDELEIDELLEKMGISKFEGAYKIPAYRTDMMHQMDLVEDIAISYGYPEFEREIPSFALSGSVHPAEKLAGVLKQAMIGLGFQQAYTFILTNPSMLFEKMRQETRTVPTIKNPTSQEFSIVRDTVVPSLVDILGLNTHNPYPQRLFEVGEVSVLDESDIGARTERRLSGVMAGTGIGFSDIKAVVEAVCQAMGWEMDLVEKDHKSFIPGRCAETKTCVFGELHPQILTNFGIEVPAVAFEFKIPYLDAK